MTYRLTLTLDNNTVRTFYTGAEDMDAATNSFRFILEESPFYGQFKDRITNTKIEEIKWT